MKLEDYLGTNAIRHDWKTGEPIVIKYTLREWSLFFISTLVGFVIAFFAPKIMLIGSLHLPMFILISGCVTGSVLAERSRLRRET